MKEQYGYVYRIYKKDNQKSYIGRTVNLTDRIYVHRKAEEKTMIISRAIKKYGWDSFNWEILERCLRQDLGQREIFWIQTFNTYKGFGYNQTAGGDGGLGLFGKDNPMYGKTVSEEEKQRRSERAKGKNNAMYGRTGPDHPAYGYKHTEETRKRIRESKLGKPRSEETKRKISETKRRKNKK